MRAAQSLLDSQDYPAAISRFENIINKEPENAQAISKAGLCYLKIGKISEAINKFKLATKLEPTNYDFWQQYGFLLYQYGKVADSIRALTKAARINPDDPLMCHQLSFLHYKNQEYDKAVNYIDKGLKVIDSNDVNFLYELLSLKALIYEDFCPEKSKEVYYSLIEFFGNDSNSYDRVSSLVIDDFNFPNFHLNLNNNVLDYEIATNFLRNEEIENSIELYKKIIREDKTCYPAFLGITQALYETKFGIREIKTFDKPENVEKLVLNYEQLNETEKNIIHASFFHFENYINKLIELKSEFFIAPIDVKLTEFPANHYLKGKIYSGKLPYCTLRGIGGDHGFVGIERLRDFLWEMPSNIPLAPACAAHEFAHQVWCILDKSVQEQVRELFNLDKENNNCLTNYASWNEQEYFAENYAYFVRLISEGKEIPDISILQMIKEMGAN